MTYMLAGGAICYKTRYQEAIALSSTEAEFVTASDAGKMALYIRSLLEDLGIIQQKATLLYEDNMGAFKMATLGQPTKRTKHINIRFYALQEWIEHNLIRMEYLSTQHNIADTLTKGLGHQVFHRHNDILMDKLPAEYTDAILTILDDEN